MSRQKLRKIGVSLWLVSMLLWSLMLITNMKDPRNNMREDYHSKLPGDMGEPAVLYQMGEEAKEQTEEGWKLHGMNRYLSDLISVHRRLPAFKHEWCKAIPDLSLQTSVIIAFHDQAWSVLLRTIHSVIDRTPTRLLKEIILVDDNSKLAHLKTELEEYVFMFPVVKLLRIDQSKGTAGARLVGARAASAPVISFLESHCEVMEGWLEPLLERIVSDPTIVAVPVVDYIDPDTLEYRLQTEPMIGGFNWQLEYTKENILEREKERRKHKLEPILTPVIEGELFTLSKKLFEDLQIYRHNFEINNLEGLDISFKVWMCGGGIETVPCSHVGQISKNTTPIEGPQYMKNKMLLANVWMGQYAKYFYNGINKSINKFDIDEKFQKELKRKLKCRTFKWYLENVYPELLLPYS